MSGRKSRALGWALLVGGVLALVLVPFALFGARVEAWAAGFFRPGAASTGWAALVIAGLLAGDVVLPVPSSLVGTAAGYLLGFAAGTAVAWAGMTAGCLLGYALGARAGRPAAGRLVGAEELVRLEALRARFGDWALVITRPVPVLAEAAVVFAGVGKMPPGRFLALTAFSNLGISAAYAAVGAFSASANSFLLAFAGAILLPLVAMAVLGRGRIGAVRPRTGESGS
jgi:uncharacterized membrane protein YdjX (TVP38/TMEM64 family)